MAELNPKITEAGATNFMLALMQAVAKDQSSLSQMQITDANSTLASTTLEESIYLYWNNQLETDSAQITKDAQNGGDGGSNPQLQADQATYNKDSATAQSEESQQDGAVQASQSQTSGDASNLQMKAQMIQAVNSILMTLTNLLGRVTA